ncbi:hypothetical protein KGF54_004262 [Candida jiufengensis]|uniref:uncharacterized protein n=1 Tax=Candida jiufengensis TaxID=497108 RepID=UPI002224CF95|nr:uncharacterized protein KGF54_004262 [Candida jiufengensis]KAI5951188.1 hypothetical protein KGF54_004262 [Candida jiufengensis]
MRYSLFVNSLVFASFVFADDDDSSTSTTDTSLITTAPETTADSPWATYPTVAKTASINGFADKIYDQLPECAKPCMFQNTGITPCPYWDTGCLCIMPMFQDLIGSCIADNCYGSDVLDARSLATSICSSAGVWEPYWMPPASVSSALEVAATAIPTVESSNTILETPSSSSLAETIEETSSSEIIEETSTSEVIETTTSSTSEIVEESSTSESIEETSSSSEIVEETTSSTSSTDTSSSLITTAPDTTTTADNPYATYPSVPRTASINGFADRIYDQLPECAKPCMFQNTGITPCPYWDTGCLCIMPSFQGLVGSCIAENCFGSDVLDARSLATSICSSAGVWDPYWMPPASVSSALEIAATAIPTIESSSTILETPSSSSLSETIEETSSSEIIEETSTSEVIETTTSSTSEIVEETDSSTSSTDTSSSLITTAPDTTTTADNPYATYPSVPRTASINGFADRIYDQLPECAKPCMFQNTGITPCPYWDTGCLCIMPSFQGLVGSCIAENCFGSDVLDARSLATSICSSAGVWEPYWMPPASVSSALSVAATAIPTTEIISIGLSSSSVAEETFSSEITISETSIEESSTSTTEIESTTSLTALPTSPVNPDEPFTIAASLQGIVSFFTTNGTSIKLFSGSVVNFTIEDGFLKVSETEYIQVTPEGALVIVNDREEATSGWGMNENQLTLTATEETRSLFKREDVQFQSCPAEEGSDVHIGDNNEGCTPIQAAAENVDDQSSTEESTTTDNTSSTDNASSTQETASVETTTQDTASQETSNTSQETYSQYTTSLETTSEETTSQETTSEETSSTNTSTQEATSEENSTEDNNTTDITPVTTTTSTSDSSLITTAPETTTADNPYATYPSVARTASINGFADRIYDQLPECAKPCMFQNTGITPCPYWDTGCLCIMPSFQGLVGSCIAENCYGSEVLDARSLATSICSSAGVWEPYWMPPASVSSLLEIAATAIPTTDISTTESPSDISSSLSSSEIIEETGSSENAEETSTSEIVEESTSSSGSSQIVEETTTSSSEGTEETNASDISEETSSTSLENVGETSSTSTSTDDPSSLITTAPTTTEDNPYATYPSVARTTSINGFADRIYDQLPECAKPCMFQNTGITPCPYWDTGCLCIMPSFQGLVGSCIAENCFGSDVLDARSLATSICSSAGVWEPYWMPPASVSSLLDVAATAIPTTDVSTTESPSDISSSLSSSEIIEETGSSENVEQTNSSNISENISSTSLENVGTSSSTPSTDISSSLITTAPDTTTTADNPYATYPSVARTASINGFADRIYDQLPECAKPCMFQNTGITPCPYWDTGCLCIMPSFQGLVGSCIAENCFGSDVLDARSLATSICSSAGVWEPYWMPPASVSSLLDVAATAVPTTGVSTTLQSSSGSPSSFESSSDIVEETNSSTTSNTVEETSPSTSNIVRETAISSSSTTESVSSETESSLPTEPVNPGESFTLSVLFNNEITRFETNGTHIKLFDGSLAEFAIEDGLLHVINSGYIQVGSLGELIVGDIENSTRGWGIENNKLTFEIPFAKLKKRQEEVQFYVCPAETGYDVRVINSDECILVEVSAGNINVTEPTTSDTSSSSIANVSTELSSTIILSSVLASETGLTASSQLFTNTTTASETTYPESTIITSTGTSTDAEGNESVFTTTQTITEVSVYCEVSSASSVQSEAHQIQTSAAAVQSTLIEHQQSVVTVIVSCESAISSLESVKSLAQIVTKTEIIASCESEIKSLSSVEEGAKQTLESIVSQHESAVQKSAASKQQSAASVQLSAANIQQSTEILANAQSAVAQASQASVEASQAQSIESVVLETATAYITITTTATRSHQTQSVAAQNQSAQSAGSLQSESQQQGQQQQEASQTSGQQTVADKGRPAESSLISSSGSQNSVAGSASTSASASASPQQSTVSEFNNSGSKSSGFHLSLVISIITIFVGFI